MDIFKLPDLGEGLPEAEIVAWFIQPGDQVSADQLMVSMETAKAIVEIPCPYDGVVYKIYGQPGDIIHTGDPLVAFNLAAAAETASNSVVGELHSNEGKLAESAQPVSATSIGVKATPAVRALAHRYDIDLAIVTPSGPDGIIVASDVERVAKIFAEVGELIPLKGVRRTMAKIMAQAHAEVVPVTIQDDADISNWLDDTDVTVRVIRAMTRACAVEPSLNAWYDSHAIGRRIIDAIHLGLAIDSSDGLFVAVIRDVQNYDGIALRAKVNTLKELVEQRKIAAQDLRGNTITLSNYGNMAGKYSTPVVVPPTVAILGTGRVLKQLRYDKDNTVIEHTLIPLSLSFDHRAITGGEAARFLAALMNDLALAD